MVRLVIELPPEQYEAAQRGETHVLSGPVVTVEIRQADGLLCFERRALLVEGVARGVIEGIADGGPPIRVFVAREEEPHG